MIEKNHNVNIIIFSNSMLSGGAEKQAVFLSNLLSEKYHTHLIIYYNKIDKRLEKMVNTKLVNLTYLKGNHINKCITLYKLLKNIKKNEYITFSFSYLATTNLINGIFSKILKIDYSIGGFRSNQSTPLKLVVQRILHNYFFNYSIVNSYSGIDYLSSHKFKMSKLIHIPNVIVLKNDRIYRKSSNKVKILSVGRFVKAKDYITAIKSIKKLVNLMKNELTIFEYTIVGYGEQESYIRTQLTIHQLEKYVKIVINPKNLESYYYNADIYLSVSIHEGLSNSIMEAISFCLPVVVTNVGDNKYLVKDNETGYVVPKRGAETIAKKVKELIINPALRSEFGHNGYNHLAKNYSALTFKSKYMTLINNLRSGETV